MCVNYPQYNKAIGISKKISMQINTFKKLGFDVYYSVYLEDGVAICHDGQIIQKQIFRNLKMHRVLRRFRLLNLCIEYLENNTFSLGFVRWDPVDRLFLKVLLYLDKQCDKVIMDFHGYFPGYSGKGIKRIYTKYTTKLNGKKMAKYVDLGFVELKRSKVFGIKTLPIDTCIDVDNYEPHSYQLSRNEINMISVSNETIYHGYDRIINGIANYINSRGEVPVTLHLVGNMTQKTIALIKKLNLNKYVKLYGYKTGSELTQIYNMCNIGVGPLAPHRVGGKEGTGIKTKEYFAIGLPYVYAGNELLVPNDFKYAYKIVANDIPVRIEEIAYFYNSIKNDKGIEENMRDFARAHYSCEKAFQTALNELQFFGE